MSETIYQLAHKGDLQQLQVRLLENKSLIKSCDESGRTVLHWAASGGRTNVVQWLIESCQADVNAKDESRWTPLIIASSAGHEASVRLLIGAGADVDACTDQGRSSLLYACSRNRKDIAKILLEDRANPNLQDKLGATPLHRSVGCGHIEIVKLLLASANEMEVNAQDNYGYTALHYACEEGYVDICKLLMVSGGNMDIANRKGQTPIQLAKPEVAKAISQISI